MGKLEDENRKFQMGKLFHVIDNAVCLICRQTIKILKSESRPLLQKCLNGPKYSSV